MLLTLVPRVLRWERQKMSISSTAAMMTTTAMVKPVTLRRKAAMRSMAARMK